MRILIFPDGGTFNTIAGCVIADVSDGLKIDEVEDLVSESKYAAVHTFADDGRLLSAEETSLVKEGLNYTETNGAPGMSPAMRPETKRHIDLRLSIEAKLGC
jgi:hypothetical protein